MKGKQIYLSVSEIDALCDFFNSFEEISTDEDTYAYWLQKIGDAQYKIFDARDKLKGKVN